MKKLAFTIFSASLLLISCKTSQLSTFNDDVYSDPTEEKRLHLAKMEAQKKQKAEQDAKDQAASDAQKAKDASNPYYQEPNYTSDDYYDYAYSSRVRRFGNPVYGAGYYDNYYTNTYWYNQNPNCYGSSIYGSYNFGTVLHNNSRDLHRKFL
ncbi:MAG: hypothetical protein IPG08_03885 [Sphingobacteriaceae bacterium]|nr:hypothetical protein [Sphingobacteriaceae bacterium]